MGSALPSSFVPSKWIKEGGKTQPASLTTPTIRGDRLQNLPVLWAAPSASHYPQESYIVYEVALPSMHCPSGLGDSLKRPGILHPGTPPCLHGSVLVALGEMSDGNRSVL